MVAEYTVRDEIKQLRGSVRLSVTHDVNEWKKSEWKAYPQERPGQLKRASGKARGEQSLQFSKELGAATPQASIHGNNRGVDTATILQRSIPIANDTASKFKSSPAKPARLHPLTADSGVLEGAPEAWQSAKDPLNANRALRKELAHVTMIRDRLKGDQPADDWLEEAIKRLPPPSRGGTGRSRAGASRGGAQSAEPRLGSRPTPILEAWSKKLAPSTAASRARTGSEGGLGSGKGGGGGGASRGPSGRVAKSGKSGGSGPLVVDRPNSAFMRQYLERQPKVGLCMLWSVGPKRMQDFEEKIKASMDDPLKVEKRQRRRLLGRMRNTLQTAMINTPTLASDLWKLYRAADSDMSGRIEYEEFAEVLDGVGIGPKRLGEENTRLLFEVADADGNGSVDFSEFLKAVVGNIVSI